MVIIFPSMFNFCHFTLEGSISEGGPQITKKIFKGLPPSTTPLERENIVGLLNQRYQKGAFCQYQK